MHFSIAGDERIASFITPLVDAVEPWQSFYAGHVVVSTAVLFVHLAALVASAGLAVAADRAVMRSAKCDDDERARRLSDLQLTHRPVAIALVVSLLSGLMLLLADLEAFLRMPAFWIKMALLLLLALNALLMMQRENQLHGLTESTTISSATRSNSTWRKLRTHAYASLFLWFAIVLAGTAMTSS